jgi:protein-tyrosine kinase
MGNDQNPGIIELAVKAFRARSPVFKVKNAASAALFPRSQDRAIGAILIDAGRLTAADVEEIRIHAGKTGARFGDAALQLNRITPEDIEFVLGQQFNYTVAADDSEGDFDRSVIAAHDPQSAVVEQLRTIRSRLSIGWLSGSKRNVLAVTSPERGEGRSWFAANLATVFAQAGDRTLLVDADMHHPQQHRLFNISNDVGLSSLLAGRDGKEIARRVHPDWRLFVVPAGAPPPNPQELLTNQILDDVLDWFAGQFDVVVLDTPAATESADAEILSARAGAAVMLTRRNITRQTKLAAAMDCLKRSGVKVIGSVMNEF